MGGCFPEYHKVPSQQGRPPQEALAQVHACTLLKAMNCRGGGLIVQQLPRKKAINSEGELFDLGLLIESCSRANNGIPPMGFSSDCHLSYDLCQRFLLGMLPRSAYDDIPALRRMRPGRSQVKAPLFVFQWMAFKEDCFPIFGCSDPKRIMKSVSRALRARSRCFKMSLGVLLVGPFARSVACLIAWTCLYGWRCALM